MVIFLSGSGSALIASSVDVVLRQAPQSSDLSNSPESAVRNDNAVREVVEVFEVCRNQMLILITGVLNDYFHSAAREAGLGGLKLIARISRSCIRRQPSTLPSEAHFAYDIINLQALWPAVVPSSEKRRVWAKSNSFLTATPATSTPSTEPIAR